LHLYGVQWRYEYFLVGADCGAAVNKNLPPLIAAMLRPEFYQSKPAEVELRQTHISYVFIAGDRVYKVKKNVKFPFLDYSTLDKRRHFCAEEVRLNRRLAPNTYLGTVGISRLRRAFSLDRGSRNSARSIEEYAVEMNRLPDSRMLSSLLLHDAVDSECLSAIAKKLAAFHARAPSDKAAIYDEWPGGAEIFSKISGDRLRRAESKISILPTRQICSARKSPWPSRTRP